MSRWKRVLFVAGLVGAVATGCGGENPYEAAENATTTTVAAEPASGGVTVEPNVFLPEGENVTDCVGTLDRPNCGSKEKGGWRQYLTFAVLIGGLAFIGWRIARGVRARDAVVNDVEVRVGES